MINLAWIKKFIHLYIQSIHISVSAIATAGNMELLVPRSKFHFYHVPQGNLEYTGVKELCNWLQNRIAILEKHDW